MGLCGGFRCGCGLTSTPAVEGEINGELPSITVTGSGEPGDPYNLTLNDEWAALVAEAIVSPSIYVRWRRDLAQAIPNLTLTQINPDFLGPASAPPVGSWYSGSAVVVPVDWAGTYLITANIIYATTSLGTHSLLFDINSGERYFPFAGAGATQRQAGSISLYLAEGDTVELLTRQGNGGDVNATATFEMVRLPTDNPIGSGP